MKRMIAIALICLFGFALGCGGSSAEAPAPETADEAAMGAEEPAPAATATEPGTTEEPGPAATAAEPGKTEEPGPAATATEPGTTEEPEPSSGTEQGQQAGEDEIITTADIARMLEYEQFRKIVELGLAKNVAVLQSALDEAPEEVRATLQHAIDVSNQLKKETEEPSKTYRQDGRPVSNGVKNKAKDTGMNTEQNIEQNAEQNTGQNTEQNAEQNTADSSGQSAVSDNVTENHGKQNNNVP